MKVCKIFRFDAAHYLPDYIGKCRNMHGHSWVLEVELGGKANKSGMVMDFALLKKHIVVAVIDILDHSLLNTFLKIPTCENLLLWIAERLRNPEVMPTYETVWDESNMTIHTLYIDNVPVVRLKLSETVDSFAELDIPTHE